MRAYYDCVREGFPTKNDLYEQLVNMPAERFWVSEERATIVVSQMMRGDKLENMLPTKREMFVEIYNRVIGLLACRRDEPLSALVFDVVGSPAPKFYMTPDSAKVIICKIKKERRKCYQEKKRKLRFMMM